MQSGIPYPDIQMRPEWRQLLIDEGLSILAAAGLVIVGGLDGIPYHSVWFCLGLALVFKVYYRLVYLRGMVYTITGEQLVYDPGTGPCPSSGSSASGRRRTSSDASGRGFRTTGRE